MSSSSGPTIGQLDLLDTSVVYPKSGLLVLTIVVIAVSVLAISLRFWARYISAGFRFGLDDWLAAGAVPCSIIICALVFAVYDKGIGDRITQVPLQNTSYILKMLYAGFLVWDFGLSLLRFSVMAFYGRIFQVRRSPNVAWVWLYNIVLGIVVVWAVAVLLFNALFACEPISKFWRPSPLFSDPGSCVDPFVVFFVGSVGNMVVDLLILIVPFPQIYKLNLPWIKKLGVAVSFVLGYGVTFISLGRMIMSLQVGSGINTDPTYYLIPYSYWNVAEIGFSIFAVCLPAIFQLSRQSQRQGVKSILRSRSHYAIADAKRRGRFEPIRRPRSRGSDPLVEPDWNNIYDGAAFGTFVEISARSGQDHEQSRQHDLSSHTGVHVRQEINIVMQDMA